MGKKKSPQESSIDFNKLLPVLKQRTEEQGIATRDWNSRALFHLIKEYREHLEGIEVWRFHKAFRQTDVTPSANVDIAFWCLLQDAKTFWEIVNEMYPE
jgi:hypothetical protein